jgi:hypothetical protein
MRTRVVDIEMPEDFSVTPYENIIKSIVLAREADKHPGSWHPESWREFACAWNAVAYRFCSCAEHDVAFTEAMKRPEKFSKSHEIYIQERELFCFFVSGMSVIESTCYALFAVGSMLDVRTFPIATPEDKRKINPEMTADKFGSAFAFESISSILQQLIGSEDYQEWKTMRNIISHRSAPPRTLFVGGEHHGEVVWGLSIQLDEHTTNSRRKWLADTLCDVLKAAETFTAACFVRAPGA